MPKGSRIDVPTGYASFPREIRPLPPRALLKKTYRVERFSESSVAATSRRWSNRTCSSATAFVKQVRGKAAA